MHTDDRGATVASTVEVISACRGGDGLFGDNDAAVAEGVRRLDDLVIGDLAFPNLCFAEVWDCSPRCWKKMLVKIP